MSQQDASLQDAFELPVVEPIRGVKVTFPLLEIDDYLPWITELHAEQKKFDAQMIATNKDPVQRAIMKRRSEQNVPGFDQVFNKVFQVDSAKRVLSMSLTKDGRTEEEIKLILRKIRPSRLTGLALEVSALDAPKPPVEPDNKDKDEDEETDPNVGQAEPAAE